MIPCCSTVLLFSQIKLHPHPVCSQALLWCVCVHVCVFLPSLPADIGYESLINQMLKDLFKLLVACVSEPAETISRVGCSCIR